ncbi:condensation domain-containing protein, partial [Streptomyces sp. NRRL F-5053]
LVRHVAEGGFDGQVGYWRSVLEGAAVELPVDHPGGGNTMRSQASVQASLGAADTAALLLDVPDVYRTQVNEVLLAALGRVLERWTGCARVAVNLEGHGREELFDGVDLTRTVGWFTAIHPVALDVSGSG